MIVSVPRMAAVGLKMLEGLRCLEVAEGSALNPLARAPLARALLALKCLSQGLGTTSVQLSHMASGGGLGDGRAEVLRRMVEEYAIALVEDILRMVEAAPSFSESRLPQAPRD